jgi:hypothetical protein
MTQILKGDTFADGQQVTGARLNQLIDSAQVLVGSITEQAAIAAGTVDVADQLNISDTSAAALRKATVGDLLGSNIPVITSSVTAGNGNDITITLNDGTLVSGNTYTSADGLTVVVTTPAAHNLVVGQVVLISGAATGYNGTFRLTVAVGTSFTYVMTTAATAGSGTLSYTKKGTKKVVGNLAVTGSAYVDGNETVGGTLRVAGATTLGSTSATSLIIGGKTPMTAEDSLSKTYVKSGNVSPTISSEFAVYTSPTLTIPADETWTYELNIWTNSGYVTGSTRPDVNVLRFRVYNNATQIHEQYGSCSPYGAHTANWMHSKALTSADNGFIYKATFLSGVSLDTPVYYRVHLTKVKTSTLSDASACI